MDLHRDRLVKLVGESIPLNRLYIMKKMPDAMWDDPEIQQGVAAYFNKMDISSRSWFLNRLKKLSLVSSNCLLLLSDNLHVMSKNQLRTFVELLSAHPGVPDQPLDRNTVVYGKSVSVRFVLCVCRFVKKKKLTLSIYVY